MDNIKNCKTESKGKRYLSLNKISYGYGINPKYALIKWLSDSNTLKFVQLWEQLNNTSFEIYNYEEICSDALNNKSYPLLKELINKAKIKSIVSDKKEDGLVYIHKDIALNYASWISPAFRTYCIFNLTSNSKGFNLVSEEDYIISNYTIANITKDNALESFKKMAKNNIENINNQAYNYYLSYEKGTQNK